MKPLVVMNYAAHYRVPLFERMHEEFGAEFVFFSQGSEEYWQPHLDVNRGRFPATVVLGFETVAKLRVNPGLARELLRRDYDVLVKCINGRLEVLTSLVVAKARRKPFVLWTEIWNHPRTAFHRLSQPVVRAVYRHSDAIVGSGDHFARFVIEEGVDPAKVFVAELAADNDAFASGADAGAARRFREAAGAVGRPLVLSVARLVPEKGLDVLLRAVSGLADLRPVVAVVGTGPLRDELAGLAAGLGVDLYLAGGLQPQDMPGVYGAADVFVLPSVTTAWVREPWGLAVNEAMNCGVPVVASTAVGAVAGGLVQDGRTGLVVPERDERALAAALRRLLTDRELAAALAARARDWVREFSYEAALEGFREVFAYLGEQRAAASRPRPAGAGGRDAGPSTAG